MTVLLVLWLIAGQPPQAYEVRFESLAGCMRAKAALEREVVRLNSEPPVVIGGQQILPYPFRLSVICAPVA